MIKEVAELTLKQFAKTDLKPEQLSISLRVIDDQKLSLEDYNGQQKFYPASLVKLFYLVAAHHWLESKQIKLTDELKRAMKDMIVDSSNDAAHYVVDLLTDTTSGPELSLEQMEEWAKKRNAINEYFYAQGYEDLNLSQKPWGDGPYGRERVFLGPNYEHRNILTANATSKLLSEIVLHRCVSKSASEQILKLLERDFERQCTDPDDQAKAFSGKGLFHGCRLWSKAGWTSTVRHDAAYIQRPDGKSFVIVTFTANHADDREIISFVVSEVCKRL